MKKIEELDYRLHRSFFKILITLPEILMIVTIAGFLIWGIVDSAVFHFEENGQYFYGVMGLPNVFLNCLIWTAIGIILGLIIYALLKILISYKVLVIANLEKISKIAETLPQEAVQEQESVKEEELSKE